MTDSSTFIYVLRPCREGLGEAPTPEEEARLEEHFHYLRSRLEEGRLILAGPCVDGALGVVVFRAFMESDPAVRHGLMTAELHPFRVSLVERG